MRVRIPLHSTAYVVPGWVLVALIAATIAWLGLQSVWLGRLRAANLRTVAFGIAIVTMGIAAGAIWEMFEWVVINVQDPVPDLMVDSLGALFAGVFATWVLKVEARSRAGR